MTQTETKATSYTVTYSDHDRGANGGSMVRETREIAERSARLMRECGYRTVEISESK